MTKIKNAEVVQSFQNDDAYRQRANEIIYAEEMLQNILEKIPYIALRRGKIISVIFLMEMLFALKEKENYGLRNIVMVKKKKCAHIWCFIVRGVVIKAINQKFGMISKLILITQ